MAAVGQRRAHRTYPHQTGGRQCGLVGCRLNLTHDQAAVVGTGPRGEQPAPAVAGQAEQAALVVVGSVGCHGGDGLDGEGAVGLHPSDPSCEPLAVQQATVGLGDQSDRKGGGGDQHRGPG